jgi:UrcA family protein
MFALAAATTLLFAGIANAGEATSEAAVRYGDLDLSTARDAAIMVDRVDHAARQVCNVKAITDPAYGAVRTYAITQFNACHEQAMQAALSRLESQEVRQAYATFLAGRETQG